MKLSLLIIILLFVFLNRSQADAPRELRIGRAAHAFDHLGNISNQAEAASACGMTIIYGTGLGEVGYNGLPSPKELAEKRRDATAYVRHAKEKGIRLAIGYVCATSIVKLEAFDKNWSEKFRAQFSAAPAEWLQQDKNGKPLPSWYGGDYRSACMNNPDWRAYEKFMVRQQLEAGYDGIFFDNPTVHPQGCYCGYCMRKFALFLNRAGEKIDAAAQSEVPFLRKLAVSRPKDFMQFRCSIAADFLAEIRSYARTITPEALITCNN
ncbi:MAG: putative glycoside hydrolase family 15 protein, partial [Verrucomicrobiota bacterium]|nr:putative glycoside hydrolase family 15 protein [Verrucomicrobiota bacterium]